MTEEVRKQILEWIYENHSHHANSDRVEMDLETHEVTTHEDEYDCIDGNKPYVDSLALEKFIKEL